MNAEEKEAVRHLAAALLAVEHNLSTPYPDDPRWTPWTRFVERPLKTLYELAYPSESVGAAEGDQVLPSEAVAASDCSAGVCRDGWRCGHHEHVHEVALRLVIEEADRAHGLHR